MAEFEKLEAMITMEMGKYHIVKVRIRSRDNLDYKYELAIPEDDFRARFEHIWERAGEEIMKALKGSLT